MAALWTLLALALIGRAWRRRGSRPLLVFALLFGLLLLWWTAIEPKQDRH